MEKGARALAWLLMAACVIGIVVLLVHPDYRKTLKALALSESEESPIWQSNSDYYPEAATSADIRSDAE